MQRCIGMYERNKTEEQEKKLDKKNSGGYELWEESRSGIVTINL